jgi:hypothetical protein
LGGDPDKDYYFAVRALDKAGNASGIVTNAPGIFTEETTEDSEGTGGSVVYLPTEDELSKEGEVLSEEDEVVGDSVEGESEKNIVERAVQFARDRTKVTLLIIIAISAALYFLYGKYVSTKGKKS